MTPTKDNTLYLTIKQVYFDQIVAGTKKDEFRDITPNTYKKYLDCDEDGEPYYNNEVLNEQDLEFYGAELLMACKDGKFPFFFKEDIKFLHLAVGYKKVRDEAIVEVKGISPLIPMTPDGTPARFDFGDNGEAVKNPDGAFAMWQAVFHLGEIVRVDRQKAHP